ncbi:hypothetical protein TIFTF001_039031 [Ficus carica]|uniref:Uncharacterized protein n=1 Tax=Ficus carica TaxID=3494 RepID=A0AA88EA10_FICCA|nr:hypothetical protein TIFTF001_039031 [Ficus carica]
MDKKKQIIKDMDVEWTSTDSSDSSSDDEELTSTIRRSRFEHEFQHSRMGAGTSNEASKRSQPASTSGAELVIPQLMPNGMSAFLGLIVLADEESIELTIDDILAIYYPQENSKDHGRYSIQGVEEAISKGSFVRGKARTLARAAKSRVGRDQRSKEIQDVEPLEGLCQYPNKYS